MSRAPPEAPTKRKKAAPSSPFGSPLRPSKPSSSFLSPSSQAKVSRLTKSSPFSSPIKTKKSHSSPFSSPFRSPSQSSSRASSLTLQQYDENIHKTQADILKYSDKDLCDLVGGIEDSDFFVLMGEQGANSKVYILNDKVEIKVAIKVVKTDDESKNEVERYMKLDAKNTGILNFPVIYRSVNCDACNEKKAGSTECTLIVSELYDGSLLSIKKEFVKNKNRESIISMLIQVIFSCSRLESMGLVHGDLHTGNILYKNLDEDQELIYEIDGKDYTIKTYGKLWVLWDFGNMVEVGKTIQSTGVKAVDTVKTDIERLVSLLGLRNKGFEELVDLIERDSTKCNDLLLYLVGL